MNRSLRLFGIASLASFAACTSQTTEGGDNDASYDPLTGFTSAYTNVGDLSGCHPIASPTKDDPLFEGRFDCGGMKGYTFLAEAEDGRDEAIIRTPHGAELRLGLPRIFGGFSHWGPKAEWRGTFASAGQVDPKALIVRYFQADENGGGNRSFLVVAKVTPDSACVYATVDGNQAGGNEKARQEVARVASVSCPATVPATGQVTSAFTDLDLSTCKASPTKNDSARLACGAMGGYALVRHPAEQQPSVGFGAGLVDLTTGELDLDEKGFVSDHPSPATLGPKADWRGVLVAPGQVNPYAVVYRYIREFRDAAGVVQHHHSLVVVKLRPDDACVYSVVDATQLDNANELAHVAADRARTESCPYDVRLPPLSH